MAAERLTVGRGGVIGRDAGKARFVLSHPQVSRTPRPDHRHPEPRHPRRPGQRERHLRQRRRLAAPAQLQPGDRIDVGPFALEYDGTDLVSRSRVNNIELVARGVTRVVADGTTANH